MFFLDYFESNLKPLLPQNTLSKILITGESHHPALLASVAPEQLPALYGGECDCEATCVYSNKGPWCQVENKVNYQDRDRISDESGADEEYKFEGSDGDDEQLIDSKQVLEIKNALGGVVVGPSGKLGAAEGHGIHIRKNFEEDDNIEDGEEDDEEEQDFEEKDIDKELIKKMFLGGMSGGGAAGMVLPGATPMNTQMEDDQ
jgi:hypothetical protein